MTFIKKIPLSTALLIAAIIGGIIAAVILFHPVFSI